MSAESKTDAQIAEAVQLAATRNRARLGTLLSLTLVALLALMWIALAFSTKNFATPNNIQNLLRQGAMTAILAIGETFVIITAGIDLSVGAVVGFTSVIIAMLLTSGFPVWAAIGITLLIGFAIGAFHAFGIAAIPRCAPSQAPSMEARPALSPPAQRVARIALSKSSGCDNNAWIEEGKLLGNGQDCPKVNVASVTSEGNTSLRRNSSDNSVMDL